MSSGALDPETLARIAAQLNPQLACDDPAKAIELARKLLIAADPERAEEKRLHEEGKRLREEGEREDKLFPRNECISVAEAFKASPGQYKIETRFAAALRKENLTTVLGDGSEVTTIRAVNELFRRQRKDKARARPRTKSRAKEKKSEKCRGISRAKSGTNPPKSGSGKPKSGSLKKCVKVTEKSRRFALLMSGHEQRLPRATA